MTPSIRQTLVEYMELVAVNKQARWDDHNHCYLDFQMSVKNAVELGDAFGSLPGAFSSFQELTNWANANRLSIGSIGVPSSHAIITYGNDNSLAAFPGSAFVWVRASSPRYREAALAWLNKLRSTRDIRQIQKRAAVVYQSVALELANGRIRKRMKASLRATQVKELAILAYRCKMASSTQQKALRDIKLLQALDTTLDADHVINRKSLVNLPDAWVMLGPVIASANRGFGRVVEKYATPFPARTGAIGLDAVTAFKLLAPTIPTPASLAEHVHRYTRQFVGKVPNGRLARELNAVSNNLGAFVLKTSKAFKR